MITDTKTLTKEEQEMADIADEALANPVEVNPEHEVEIALDEQKALAEMYNGTVDAGTEEIDQSDLNTPTLKAIQDNTKNIENKKVGWFYRTDTKEQLETVDVNLVYVTTVEKENYERTAIEKVKVYYGYYSGTKEPFKMFVQGWNLASHRVLQTEITMYKNRYKVPMFALTLHLTTGIKSGQIKKTGKDYSIFQIIFNVVKNPKDTTKTMPLVEMNPERISFLFESAERFKALAAAGDAKKDDAEEVETKNREDMPF